LGGDDAWVEGDDFTRLQEMEAGTEDEDPVPDNGAVIPQANAN
jgi:hypothetical protein